MARKSPLSALQSEVILSFFVPKIGAASTMVSGVQTFDATNEPLDKLTYSIYLQGADRNPFEFFGLSQAELPLMGYLLDPLQLDERVGIGTQAPGIFQGSTGYFKRVFCDKGLPIVSRLIGEKVAFIFSAQSVDFDTVFDCSS